MTLTNERGRPLTIPCHGALRVGTLAAILRTVASYQERSVDDICDELFG